MNNRRTREILAATALLVLTATAYFLTFRIDMSFSSDLETLTGPRAYPRIILSVMAILGLLLLVRGLRLTGVSDHDVPGNMKGVFLAIGLSVLFVVLFEPLGYILAVPLLVFATGLLFGKSDPLHVALYAILVAAVVLISLRYGLNTVVPEGLLSVDDVLS